MMKTSERERFGVLGAAIVAMLVTFSGTTQAMHVDLKKPDGPRIERIVA